VAGKGGRKDRPVQGFVGIASLVGGLRRERQIFSPTG
jgi:hypothetical protein